MTRRGLVTLGLSLACLFGGFLAGRWTVPAAKPLTIGATTPQPERDRSPAGEVRTVIVTRTIPGKPAPPPAAPGEAPGTHLSTTTTALPPLHLGGTFHSAVYGRLEGPRLTLRTMEWLDSPAGRVSLGEATTTEAVTSFPMPEARPLPRWTAAALPYVKSGRLRVGGMIEHTRGPLVIGAGHVDGRGFGIIGARW